MQLLSSEAVEKDRWYSHYSFFLMFFAFLCGRHFFV